MMKPYDLSKFFEDKKAISSEEPPEWVKTSISKSIEAEDVRAAGARERLRNLFSGNGVGSENKKAISSEGPPEWFRDKLSKQIEENRRKSGGFLLSAEVRKKLKDLLNGDGDDSKKGLIGSRRRGSRRRREMGDHLDRPGRGLG